MSKYLNKDGISYLTYRYSYVFAPKSHTHNYAASDKAGGAAMSTYGTLTLTVNTTSYVFDGSKDKSPVITKASIGLSNVDNTSDSNKSVKYAGSAGSATNATIASKLGTLTVGSETKPIYLNAGTAKASSSNVGSITKPIYLNSGVMTACSTSLTDYLPLSGGTLTGQLNVPSVYVTSYLLGESGTINHAIWLGHSSQNYCDFYEYGGVWNFYKSVSGTKTLLAKLGTTNTFANSITSSSTIQGTQLQSTIATGTAPLTVNSTTVVTNLNADKLDGYDASSFATSGHSHNISLASSTGTSSITLSHGSKYQLTACGSSLIFTMPTDTKATSSNTSSKIYLTGATSQSTAGQTHYSNSLCYAQNSYLYSYGNKVIAENDALTTTEVESICKEILGV